MEPMTPRGPKPLPTETPDTPTHEDLHMPTYSDTTLKPKSQSKTIWGIITGVIGVILTAFGIAADPSFLADGFQLGSDFVALMGFITAVMGWALKNYGLRDAKQPLK